MDTKAMSTSTFNPERSPIGENRVRKVQSINFALIHKSPIHTETSWFFDDILTKRIEFSFILISYDNGLRWLVY